MVGFKYQLRLFLKDRGYSFSQIRRLLQQRGIKVNTKIVIDENTLLKNGDLISIGRRFMRFITTITIESLHGL